MPSQKVGYLVCSALASAVLFLAASCSSPGSQPEPAPTTIEPESNQSEGNGGSIEPTQEAGTATAEPSAQDSEEGHLLPFDGGSYTWANGVTMKLKVIRVEPWGTTDDYCGDGSCGVSNPNDTRFVLRYFVSVPKSFKGAFDPVSCPGDMHVATGNDDDSFNYVAGDYYKPLDGKILPGATKYGDNEYSIEKKAINTVFYIESMCGDTEYSGEPAYFGGKIPKRP